MQLVPINVVENTQYVSGRDLHMFLEIKPHTLNGLTVCVIMVLLKILIM